MDDAPSNLRFVHDLIETNRRLVEKLRQMIRVVEAYEEASTEGTEAAVRVATKKDELLLEVQKFL